MSSSFLAPITLRGTHATLEPLTVAHHDALVAAASDGELWKLWYTTVASPDNMQTYIATALNQQQNGFGLPFVIRDNRSGDIVGCTRYMNVEFRTHWMNHQSRTAITALGAKQDGILRNHQRLPDGSLRDTVVFSIIESEWPAVKAHLQYKLAR
jgi:RimJ/RimL family protein N-acetyltransferase